MYVVASVVPPCKLSLFVPVPTVIEFVKLFKDTEPLALVIVFALIAQPAIVPPAVALIIPAKKALPVLESI